MYTFLFNRQNFATDFCSFYIVLNGKVTIYILNKDQVEGEEDDGNFDNIIEYTKDGCLDRSKLGYCVTSLGKIPH